MGVQRLRPAERPMSLQPTTTMLELPNLVEGMVAIPIALFPKSTISLATGETVAAHLQRKLTMDAPRPQLAISHVTPIPLPTTPVVLVSWTPPSCRTQPSSRSLTCLPSLG